MRFIEYLYVSVYLFIFSFVCVCLFVCVFVYVNVSTCLYVHMCISVCVCIGVCLCACDHQSLLYVCARNRVCVCQNCNACIISSRCSIKRKIASLRVLNQLDQRERGEVKQANEVTHSFALISH